MSERLNIQFNELRYSVRGFFDSTPKEIIKGISGEFRAGELSAILGPSGGGKSTLLNILSGYTTNNISGSIIVNGVKRNEEKFRQLSTYIMQEENLYGLLTMRETMTFSIRLKTAVRCREKINDKITEILGTLSLESQAETLVKNLSGGQQKRLSIAMELVNHPSTIFLDEPTTGLDSSSTTQCVSMLKKLALEGKTIICTVHQPSSLIFKMFDHLYTLVDGKCIYQGTPNNLVSFLAEEELICPESYNPADYLLEIATDGYGDQNNKLTEKIENGKNINYREPTKSTDDGDGVCEASRDKTSASFAQQVYQLTKRNMIFNIRNKSFMLIRIAVHIYIGILVGLMYFKIGNQAKQMINIYKSFLVLTIVLMYTSIYSLMVRFPLELVIIRREHFNGWYSMAAHYISLVLADSPIIFICSLLYTSIGCVMMDHPLDTFRFGPLLAICVVYSYTAQAYGIFAGSFVEIKLTVLFAALLMLYQILFAGGLVFMKDVGNFWHPFFEISFAKHGMDGYTTLLLGFNRTKLSCDYIYCYFEAPEKFLTIIGMNAEIPKVFYSLAIIFLSFHFFAYTMMRFRVSNQSFFDRIKI